MRYMYNPMMAFKRIFISHAGADVDAATKLAAHLKNAGHAVDVDVQKLGLGDDSIAFMNDGIADAHTVVILFSKHTAKAKWQKLEIHSAVWNEHAQDGGNCIVVRLDDTPLPPLLGPKVYGKLDPNDHNNIRTLVEHICKSVESNSNASSVLAAAVKASSTNPFRNLRAEFFENRPDLHAKAFASPNALTLGALEEMKPCLLEGSRGTGKSMLLLSLRARNLITRDKTIGGDARIFGSYLKLSRGAICNTGVGAEAEGETLASTGRDSSQITDIAAQELIIQIIESMFSELHYCISEKLVNFEGHLEKPLAEAADMLLFTTQNAQASSLDELLDKLSNAHMRIAEFIRRKFIYGESPSVPTATFDLEQLRRVIKLIKRHVRPTRDAMFVVLLDEYENLFPYQQRIINGLVKLGPPDVSVKIAKKLGSGDNSGTITGQEIQEIHDYTRIPLVYDVQDPRQLSDYHKLLNHIVANILSSEGLGTADTASLLPEFSNDEVSREDMLVEVAKLCKKTPSAFKKWSADKQAEKCTYYKEAATYRVLYGVKGRHPDKRFAGFDQLAFLSSGVIRYFQEILGVSYHLTFGSERPQVGQLVLPSMNQSRAVHLVSQHNLTTLSRNIERHGEELKFFLLDLGGCLRHKLLKNTSEPEAARLTVEDPERLEDPGMADLKRLLVIGMREGVFQTKEGLPAFKPKHLSDPQPSEFNICRIYAPVLQISPRLRWRTNVKCQELLDLIRPGMRAKAVLHLKTNMVRLVSNDSTIHDKNLWGQKK